MTPFAARLLKWYEQNARDLPWRRRVTPYRTWVSEVMLQQTRVETVMPYFRRWMIRFPTLRRLSQASEREVLLLWEGLGYYSRARNLRNAARLLVRHFDGKIPSKVSQLSRLPGVGPYTAGAIASIAFGVNEAAMDGNIRRVLARVFYVKDAAKDPKVEKRLWEIARTHLPKGKASEYNQSLMDLGATICLPNQPQCIVCPVRGLCLARKRGEQGSIPRRQLHRSIPHHVLGAVVVRRNRSVLIAKRVSKNLLGGMWEFPKAALDMVDNGRLVPGRRFSASLKEEHALRVWNLSPLLQVQHAYSHFRVTVHAFRGRGTLGSSGRRFKWVRVVTLSHYPMGRVDRMIARHLQSDKNPEAAVTENA
ncbi:MAG TPA: A/G-specific adenine glycosylase [Anaerolineales bacterium]